MSDGYLPKALSHSVMNMTGVKRQPIKFSPQTSSEANSSQVIRCRLPQGILDLATFTMQARIVIHGNDTGVQVAWPTALYKYFQAVRFYVGGQLVSGGQCNHYNVLKNLLLKCQTSKQMYDTKPLNGFWEDNVGRAAGNAGRDEDYFIEDNWLGLPTNGGRYVNTDLWGDVEVEIILAPDNVIKAIVGTGSRADLSYSLEKISFVVDRVSPPRAYLEIMSNLIRSNRPISFPYQNVVSTKSNLTGNNRLAVSSGCIDAFLATPAGAVGNNDEYENGEFIHDVDRTNAELLQATWQLLVGENSIPNYPENGYMAFDYTSNLFQRDNLDANSQLSINGDIAAYFQDRYVIGLDLTFEGKSGYVDGVLNGVNSMNTPMDFQFTTNGFVPNQPWLFFLMTTAVLTREMGPDGSSVVRVQY